MATPLDVFLSHYYREAREMALCLRAVVLTVFPSSTEAIDAKAELITYSTAKGKPWAVAIAPHQKYVNLLFGKGTQLSNPSGLLVGTGKETRHFRIKSEEETQSPDLKALLVDAFRLG